MQKVSPVARLKTLKLIHGAMAFMLALFGAITYYLTSTDTLKYDSATNDYLTYFPPAIMIVMLLSGSFIFNSFIRGKKGSAYSLERKILAYQSAIIVRNAFFEVPALTAAVVVLMTGKIALLLVLVIALVLFYVFRPTASSLASDMELSRDEISRLEGG